MSEILEVIGALLMVLGALLAAIGGLGLLRLPDLYSRLHAATKPQTLGLLLVLGGLALVIRTWSAVTTLIIVLGAQALTAPMAAHLLGRATHRTQSNVDAEMIVCDELTRAHEQANSPAHEQANSPAPAGDEPPAS